MNKQTILKKIETLNQDYSNLQNDFFFGRITLIEMREKQHAIQLQEEELKDLLAKIEAA
jgi:regulator of replication initiation timing